MRGLFLIIVLLGSVQAQEVARVAGVATFATSGGVFVTTRQPPSTGGIKPKPEIIEIVTGKDGAASVALGAMGSVKMEPNTHIRMSAQTAPQSLEMLKGKLFLNIDSTELKKRQNTEFKLRTPAALLAVKGTSFFVSAQEGTETLGVHEGAAMVQTPASRTGVLLQKGQASLNAPGQPLQPKAMSADELALDGQYATFKPLKNEVALHLTAGTSGMVTRYYQGALTTVDATANSGAEPSLSLSLNGNSACSLTLKESGEVHARSLQSTAALTQNISLTVSEANVTKPFAVRFYFRSLPGSKVMVNGRVMNPPEQKPTAQPQAAPWIDCLIGTTGSSTFELTLAVDASQTRSKKIKEGEVLLELSDFVLLSEPVMNKP